MMGVIGVGIFHYSRAASASTLSQAEGVLFTVIELCLSIYASWTISSYFARRTAIQESTETSRLFGSAAIRRVEGIVDSLDRLEAFLRKRRESISHTTELNPELVQEYLDHAEDNAASIRTTALNAIEDWLSFSGVSRESTSVYRQLATRSKQLQIELAERSSELERNKDAAEGERAKQQNDIRMLREQLAQVQHKLAQQSDHLFGPRLSQTTLGLTGITSPTWLEDSSARRVQGMSETPGVLISAGLKPVLAGISSGSPFITTGANTATILPQNHRLDAHEPSRGN